MIVAIASYYPFILLELLRKSERRQHCCNLPQVKASVGLSTAARGLLIGPAAEQLLPKQQKRSLIAGAGHGLLRGKNPFWCNRNSFERFLIDISLKMSKQKNQSLRESPQRQLRLLSSQPGWLSSAPYVASFHPTGMCRGGSRAHVRCPQCTGLQERQGQAACSDSAASQWKIRDVRKQPQ